MIALSSTSAVELSVPLWTVLKSSRSMNHAPATLVAFRRSNLSIPSGYDRVLTPSGTTADASVEFRRGRRNSTPSPARISRISPPTHPTMLLCAVALVAAVKFVGRNERETRRLAAAPAGRLTLTMNRQDSLRPNAS